MRSYLWLAAVFVLLGPGTPVVEAASPWGANYFPNVPLTTSERQTVHFFDDLIEGRIVSINFIYTSCPDTCPLETAQLVKVQNIMGDRVGRDVFFYSITIDPGHDTPEVLQEYKDRFGARWTFLTGKEEDITRLRRKLGLYIEEIQDGSNNHNVSMIIGNQATGRWMKRSPFENPYVLADQIGNWLDGWKAPPRGQSYASAPKLRSISPGEQLFRTRCASCHTLTGSEEPGALGPDLLGVTRQREMEWLLNWLRVPDQMLAEKDPIAMSLYKKYNSLAMPNMRLNRQEATDLISFIENETRRRARKAVVHHAPERSGGPLTTSSAGSADDVVAVMNAWVREAHPRAKVNAGYMTLVNTGTEEVTLTRVESGHYRTIEVHEMAMVDGLMEMLRVTDMRIPPNSRIELEPGGKHLMLMDPLAHLASGQQLDMTLTFKSGRRQIVSVNVESR